MIVNDKNAQTQTLNGFGARLRAARESMRLSDKEAAARLHLNPNIITIIENEQFENAPPMIFMRGYLRSYAKLLNLSEEEVNTALNQLEKVAPTGSGVAIQRQKMETEDTTNYLMRGMNFLIVLLLLTLVAVWWQNNHKNAENKASPVTETSAIDPSATQPAPGLAPMPEPQAPVAAQPAPAPQPAASMPTPETAATADPAAPAPTNEAATPAIPGSAQPLVIPAPNQAIGDAAPANTQPEDTMTDEQPAPAPTPTKPSKHLNHMKMALPEQGLEPTEDEMQPVEADGQ